MKTFTNFTAAFIMLCFSFICTTASIAQNCATASYNQIGSIPSTLTSGSYNITTTFIDISNSTVIEDAEVLLEPNTVIIIREGVTLTINGCHLYSCTDMWQGIIIETGGRLIIDKGVAHDNSLIEDADIAVQSQYWYYDILPGLGGPNALEVNNAIFNRNRIEIDLGYGRNEGGNQNLFPRYYPVTLKNSIFTCRDIPFNAGSNDWVRFVDFRNTTISNAATYPATPETNSSPYINETQYSSTNSNAYLKPPFTTNTKSEIGINISELYHYNGIYKIGDLGNAASKNVTIFDNQTVGVKLYSTDAKFVNCTFQNTPNANPDVETHGILAEHYDEAKFSLDVSSTWGEPHNTFFDCKHAITSNFYTNVNITMADIRSSKTVPLNQVQEGYEGISIKTSSFGWNLYSNAIIINWNDIMNIAYPITIKYDDAPWRAGQGYPPTPNISLTNSIEINTNHIALFNRNNSFTSPLGGFIEQAITLEVVIPSVVTSAPYPPLRVTTNYFSGANHGIKISNWEGKDIRLLNNYVLLNAFPSVASSNASAIDLNGCISQSASGNFIYGNGSVGYDNNPNMNYATNMSTGITVSNGSGFTIRCNDVGAALKSMCQFRGNIPNTYFFNNRLNGDFNHGENWGLVLNRAIIGQQGSARTACDNNYFNNGYWINNSFKTYCINSDARLSPMYVQLRSTAWDPAVNGYSSGGGRQFTPYGTANTLFSGTANGYGCPWISNRAIYNDAGELIIQTEVENADINEDEIPIRNDQLEHQKVEEAIQLARGLVMQSECEEPELRLYVSQMQLYKFLLSPNGWVSKSPYLAEFVEQSNGSSFGVINEISKNILNGDTSLALEQLAGWNKINRVDENYAKFLLWTIRRQQHQSLNLDEIVELSTRCPQTDGNVVFAAQNLYNAITNEHRLFTTNCDIIENGEQGRGVNQSISRVRPTFFTEAGSSDSDATIFPNPAQSVVNIKANNLKKIELLNAFGAVVRSQNANCNSASISINNLSSGMYFVKMTDENNKVTVKKIFKNLY